MPTLEWDISPMVFTPQGLLNPAVVAMVGILLTQLLKAAVPEKPWKPLVVMALCVLIVGILELYVALIVGGQQSDFVTAALLTLWAAAAATFGYEAVKNIAKALGLWKSE